MSTCGSGSSSSCCGPGRGEKGKGGLLLRRLLPLGSVGLKQLEERRRHLLLLLLLPKLRLLPLPRMLLVLVLVLLVLGQQRRQLLALLHVADLLGPQQLLRLLLLLLLLRKLGCWLCHPLLLAALLQGRLLRLHARYTRHL